MAGILRGIFRFHKYLNPEDYTTYGEFRESAKYAGYTTGGTIGAGFGQDAAYGRRIKYKTGGVANWLANRLKHGITSDLPERPAKRQKTFHNENPGSMGYATTGTNTVVTRSKKGKWPKKRRIEKLAARLRYINDATGNICTWIYGQNVVISAGANASATKMLTFFTGTGGSLSGKNDLGGMFPIAVDRDPAAGAVAALRTASQHIYLKSAHVSFDVSLTSAADGIVELYECICLKDVGNGEIDMAGDDNFVDDWINRMPKDLGGMGATPGTAVLSKTSYMNNPYFWHEFGAYYKIQRVTKLSIQAGKSVQFERHYPVHKIIDADTLSGNDHFRYLTRIIVCVVRGVQAGSATTGAPVAAVTGWTTYKFTSRDVNANVFTTSATRAT